MNATGLVDRVSASTGLSQREAMRLIEDVIADFRESVEGYVRRRHAELKARGMKNPQIFVQVTDELATRVVAAPQLSERQLRRIVYG